MADSVKISKLFLALAFWMGFMIGPLKSQEGNFSVRIKQPAVDTLQTCPGKAIIFMAEGLNNDGSSFDPNQAVFNWDFGYQGQSFAGAAVTFT